MLIRRYKGPEDCPPELYLGPLYCWRDGGILVGQWEHSAWEPWCHFCGMDPRVEGPPELAKEIGGLADIIGYGKLVINDRPQVGKFTDLH